MLAWIQMFQGVPVKAPSLELNFFSIKGSLRGSFWKYISWKFDFPTIIAAALGKLGY